MNLTTKNKFLIGAGIVVLLFLLWLATSYNGLVKASLGVDNAWADIEAQYQRRFDLIPRLLETVKGYKAYEEKVFVEITQMRSQWQSAKQTGDVDSQLTAARGLDSSLARLLAVVENYPDLKASQSFHDFMISLEGTENRIATSRIDYNNWIRTYNTKTRTFPSNLVASWFGFKQRKSFEAAQGAANAPEVKF
jgi:LemA protein